MLPGTKINVVKIKVMQRKGTLLLCRDANVRNSITLNTNLVDVVVDVNNFGYYSYVGGLS